MGPVQKNEPTGFSQILTPTWERRAFPETKHTEGIIRYQLQLRCACDGTVQRTDL
jgi:hypothetical protein